MKRYLLEDYRGLEKGVEPKVSVIDEKKLFKLVQDRVENIAVSEISEFCLIDWS